MRAFNLLSNNVKPINKYILQSILSIKLIYLYFPEQTSFPCLVITYITHSYSLRAPSWYKLSYHSNGNHRYLVTAWYVL